MPFAIKFYGAGNPLQIPAQWPERVLDIAAGQSLPDGYDTIMTGAELRDHRTLHRPAFDVWRASALNPKVAARLRVENSDRAQREITKAIVGPSWMTDDQNALFVILGAVDALVTGATTQAATNRKQAAQALRDRIAAIRTQWSANEASIDAGTTPDLTVWP